MRRHDPLHLNPIRGHRPDRSRRVPTGIAAGVVAAAMLLGGCQPADDMNTSPPISPILPTEQTTSTGSATSSASLTSASPSPSRVVTARPTTPEETAALAAEAEHVYREMRRLVDLYESQDGAETLPEPLKEFVGGKYARAVELSLQYTREQGGSIQGSTKVTRGQPFSDGLEPESLIGHLFCNDMTGRISHPEGATPFKLAVFVTNQAQFSRGTDGRLRITDNIAEEASSCGD